MPSSSVCHLGRFRPLALVLGLLAAMAAQAQPFDLKQCVDAALAQNPEMVVGQARVAQADSAVRAAEGARLPRVELSLNATRTNDALNAFGLKVAQQRIAAADMSPAALNNPDGINNFNPRIEVRAPLYTGGQLTAQGEQARAMARAARDGDQAARQRLIRQVVEAYQGVHAARAYITVGEQAEAAAVEFVRVSEKLLAQGMAVKSDVLAAKVNLDEARLRLAEARRREAGALDQLKLLMGRPLDEALELMEAGLGGMPEEDLPRLSERALREHPGLLALRAQVDAARAGIESARAASKPQLSLLARQDWNDDTPGFGAGAYTLGGVLSWTAFDGGVARAATDRAQAGRAEVAALLKQAEDGVIFEVREAWRRVREAEQRLAARAESLKDAEEAQRLTRKRYENGVTTLVDLLAGQTRLDKARADQVAARFDLAVGRVELKRAAGLLTLETL